MRRTAILILAPLVLMVGCAISGHYVSSGPCKGFHTNQQACQRAAENAAAIARVKMGQTTDEVTAIMGKGPERREGTEASEAWSYLTDYDAELMTTIIFHNGVVAEIKQSKWLPEPGEAQSPGV